MTVRPGIVLARLAHLGRVLAELERLRTSTPEERATFVIQLAAERALHVAAEAIFDVGHHVLAGRGKAVPPTYREVAPQLAVEGVLTAETARGLDGLAGLRNLLVHDYGEVDTARLWALIDTRLPALRAAHAELAAIPELAHGGLA